MTAFALTADLAAAAGPLADSQAAAAALAPLEHQLHRFFHRLDESRYAAMLELLTDDCRWLRQGRWLEGKAAVLAALQERPADSRTRHLLSNSHLRQAEDGRMVVESYMTAYRYPVAGAGDPLPVVAGPVRFNLVSTVFRRDAGHDWRIAEQQLVPAFGFAG